jgi:flagellar motor component MotA
MNMKLPERLNVLIQATTLSQKSGALTLDEAANAKTAIDIIYTGILNQKFAEAINTLIAIVVSSQKTGVYSLKDAHMIYLALDGIDLLLQNESRRINEEMMNQIDEQQESNTSSEEFFETVPPKTL